ncbi:hypothetical protein [Jiangella muralis]|uniref:hypothetical protein n=1 Tax=Jiangella muralis TaxID=702383 RepID=UPI0012F70DC7|nr:hypothetical protein [Jiangella muralis]
MRTVAGKQVYEELRGLMTVIHRFNRMLDQTATYHQRLRDDGAVDDSTAISQRVALGDVAEEITKKCEALEETIRRDLGG